MTAVTRSQEKFVDLVISEAQPTLKQKVRGQYRLCTLTKTKDGQRFINLRVPESVQDTIIGAYEEGKTVRIFA